MHRCYKQTDSFQCTCSLSLPIQYGRDKTHKGRLFNILWKRNFTKLIEYKPGKDTSNTTEIFTKALLLI